MIPGKDVLGHGPCPLDSVGLAGLRCASWPDNTSFRKGAVLLRLRQDTFERVGIARVGSAHKGNVAYAIAAQITAVVATGLCITGNGKELQVTFVLCVHESAFPARFAVCLLERLWQIVCTGNIGGFVFDLRVGFGLQAALVGRFVKRRRNCRGSNRRIFGFARHRNRKHQRGEQNQRRQKNNRRQVAPCPSFHILILHSHFRRRAQIAARRWKSSVLCLTGAPYTPDRS